MLNVVVATVLGVFLASCLVWLQIGGHQERKRRKLLSPQEQEQLAHEDAQWLQWYQF